MASRVRRASLAGRASQESLLSLSSRECQESLLSLSSRESLVSQECRDSQDTNSILNLEYRITNERSRTPGHVEIT